MADKESGDAIQDERQASGSSPGLEGMIYEVAHDAASSATPDLAGAAQAATAASQSTDQATASSDKTTTARDNDSSGASGDDESGCRAHDGEDFIAYCRTCGCLVCVDCFTGSDKLHGLHDTIKIKKLLQNPEVFTETLKKLSSLLEDKEQHVKTLEQFTIEVTAGHKAQSKKIKDAETEAIQQLNNAFDREVAKLKSDRNQQEATIKQVAQQALKQVEKHGKEQIERVQSEHCKVKASVPPLSAITATLDLIPAQDTLPSIVKANEEGKSVLLKEDDFRPLTDVEPTANDVDATGVQDFTDQTVHVTPLPRTTAESEVQVAVTQSESEVQAVVKQSDAKSQTQPITSVAVVQTGDDLGTLVHPHSDVPALRQQIGKLVPADTSVHNESKAGSDRAYMDRQYHVACHDFATGKTNIFPGPFREPDVTRPFSVNHDITCIPASDAAALTSLVGGKRSLTRKRTAKANPYLEDDQGAMVYCNAWLYDDKGNPHTNKSGKPISYACYLPAAVNMGETLDKYLGWRPSGVKEKETGKGVSMDITVKQWRASFDHRTLIVLQ